MFTIIHPSISGLALKPFVLEDAKALSSLIEKNRAHLRQRLPWLDQSTTENDSVTFIMQCIQNAQTKNALSFAIWLKHILIGTISFHFINADTKECALGYWIDSNWEGKGIMSAATKTMIQYAFDGLSMETIIIRCGIENDKSRAIPKRLGFIECDRLINAENLYGQYHDLIIYRLHKIDYQASAIYLKSSVTAQPI